MMTIGKGSGRDTPKRSVSALVPLGIAAAVFFVLTGTSEGRPFCSATARIQFEACLHEVQDDSLTQKAVCLNTADEAERSRCSSDLMATQKEELKLCEEQRNARLDICAAIGEERYNPDFDPANFDVDFTNPPHLNPYYPLKVGNQWTFASPAANETNEIEVLASTKLIEGVTCVVSRDLVKLNGLAKEFTDDWLAQAKNSDVVYCGEEVKDFERFPGDNPNEPELVSIDGSFKVGRNGAKPGIFFLGTPSVGITYRQEYSLGNAEDHATVASTTYGFGNDPVLDEHVPEALAAHLCNNDCVVTVDGLPFDPGVLQRKYFARNIGTFLEVDVDTGEINRLTGCNVDPKCDSIPQP